ncbi:MAG: zinc-ribbon domain-containing protein [Candidatus Methylomirabilales bacterium]
MTVTCPSCHASLSVPDDRLPKGKAVTATCPRCKGPIQIDLTGAAAPPVAAAAPPAPPAAPAPPLPAGGYDEQRQPRALVCAAAEERAQILASLKDAGYQAQAVADAGEALERLRFTPHAVAVIRDGFGAADASGNPLLDGLADLGMATRRHFAVVLVSDRVPALDPMAAFARSVDLVIHPNDLQHLPDALRRCTADVERKYRALTECMRALGKG